MSGAHKLITNSGNHSAPERTGDSTYNWLPWSFKPSSLFANQTPGILLLNNAGHSCNIIPNHLELPPYPGVALTDVHLIGNRPLAAEDFAALMSAEIIGFDTESKPTFRKGDISTGPHLVQLAIDTGVYLFQITHLHNATALKSILESPKSLKVGFGLGNDHAILKSRLDIEANNVLDLGEALRGTGRGTVGAKAAVATFFGQKMQKSKRISTSNWAAPHLSSQQILYAANDALVALEIYRAWAHNSARFKQTDPPIVA